MSGFPTMTGDHARDLDALREYLREIGNVQEEGFPPSASARLLCNVLDAAIAILADFQRKQAELELRLRVHTGPDGGHA